MYKFILFSLSLMLLNACSEKSSNEQDHKLELQWELTGLSTPESALYDSVNNVIYVSNINGSPTEKDNNGFISTISPEGKVISLNWIEGLNAPKGMAIHSGKLYVADIDTLVVIDINNSKIVKRFQDHNARFLNDVTITDDGKVFVSDMMTNTIYCLEENSFGVWLNDELLASPNGLHAEPNQLIVGSWGIMTDDFETEIPGHLLSITLNSKTISNLGNGKAIGNLDGVEPFGENFLVTDWMAGKLYEIDRSGKAQLLLELEKGMADHEFIAEQNLILLPMMKNDKLLAYSL